MESYGGKKRAAESVHDPNSSESVASHVANQLKELQKYMSPFIIERLTSFFEDQFRIESNNVVFRWGIGCTVKARNKDNSNPTYSVINSVPCPFSDCDSASKYFSHTHTNKPSANNIAVEEQEQIPSEDEDLDAQSTHVYDFEQELDDQSDLEAIENKEEEDQSNFDKNGKLVPFVPLKYRWYSTYPIYGMCLPVMLHPTTVTLKRNRNSILTTINSVTNRDELSIYRIQQYCVKTRCSLGEFTMKDAISKRAGVFNYDVFGTSERSFYNHKNSSERMDTFINYLNKNLEDIKLNGNAARIEIAFDVKCSKRTDLLVDAVRDTESMVKQNLKAYNASDLADIVAFLL